MALDFKQLKIKLMPTDLQNILSLFRHFMLIRKKGYKNKYFRMNEKTTSYWSKCYCLVVSDFSICVKVVLTMNVNFDLIDELSFSYLIRYITIYISIQSSLFETCIIMTVNHKKESSKGRWIFRLI